MQDKKQGRLLDKPVKGEYPFSYTPSYATDVKATIERVRRQQQPQAANVSKLPDRRR